MSTKFGYILFLFVGAGLGIAGYSYYGKVMIGEGEARSSSEPEPLYWVAPMDPDYRRDQPGKSPMGMDLVPVFEEATAKDDSPGTVRISPDVVNNLGVRTAEVMWGMFDATINTVGYVQYDEDALVHIHPRVEGWIEKLHVKAEGDPVGKGDALYEIYSPALVNAQEELILALNRNNQRLITAATARLQALQLPPSTIEQLIKTRQTELTVIMFSPQSGVIDNLNIREGFFVKPGTTMMSIGSLDPVWVIGEVFERQMMNVKKGDKVFMQMDYFPGYKWHGKVDYIYPTLNNKTRTARIRMIFENPDQRLKPDMFARLTIKTKETDQSLLIPNEALIRTGDQDRVVLSLGEGKFKSIVVAAGRVGIKSVEILNGLQEGDRIVTSAQFMLDSESSRTSDFKRFSHSDESSQQKDSVWVEAKVNSILKDRRMVNLDHPVIEKWNWPQMTMDFNVAESIEYDALQQDMTVHVEISKMASGQYEISAIHIPDDESKEMANNKFKQMQDNQAMDQSAPGDIYLNEGG